MDGALLRGLADDRALTGNDLRIALQLAGRYCRPGDLVDLSVNRSKSMVSHALRHLQDRGWLIVQEHDGVRYYGLIDKLSSRREVQEPKPKDHQIPGQMTFPMDADG